MRAWRQDVGPLAEVQPRPAGPARSPRLRRPRPAWLDP